MDVKGYSTTLKFELCITQFLQNCFVKGGLSPTYI